MKIRKVSVTNFKSIKEEIILDNLKPISVFVGPNNSGKSNIIKLFEFFKLLAQGSRPQNMVDYIFDKKNEEISIELQLELSDEERYKIIQMMPEIDHVFDNIDLANDFVFKLINYKTNLNKLGFVSEELSIGNSSGTLVTIIKNHLDGNYMESNLSLLDLIQNQGNTNFGQGNMKGSRGVGKTG